MANIVLQSQDLVNTANKIDASGDVLEDAFNKVDSTMSDLQGVWNDINSKKYLDRYNELKQEFPKFIQDVRSYGVFLNTVVNTYRREFIEAVSETVN